MARQRLHIVGWTLLVLVLTGLAGPLSAQEEPADTAMVRPSDPQAHIAVYGREAIQKWNSLSGPQNRTATIDSLVREGESLLLRAERLVNQIGYEKVSEQQQGGNLRLMALQNDFLDVLKWLEIERARDYPLERVRTIFQGYEQERERLLQEMKEKRQDLIASAERFLATYKQSDALSMLSPRDQAELVADVRFRLADLYVKEADDKLSQTSAEYMRRYNEWADGGMVGPEPEVPQKEYGPALRQYQDIVDNYSGTSFYPQALYNVAVIMSESEESGLKRRAQSKFETIADQYSRSEYADEALYRLGKYQFEEEADMAAAIPYFERVLEYPSSRYYASALYMLGWCYFRKNAVEDAGLTGRAADQWTMDDYAALQEAKDKNYIVAVQYFDDAVKYSREQKAALGKRAPIEAVAMESEAIDYLATCFTLDHPNMEWTGAGINNAVSFLHEEDWRYEEYGYQLLEKMGNLYMEEIQMDTLAILAWEAAINQYPLEPPNPELQERIIDIYWNKMYDPQAAYIARQKLFDRYRRGTAWDSVNNDTDYRPWADSLIAKEYYLNYTMTMDTLFNQRRDEAIESALKVSTNYLTEFPLSEKTPQVEFSLAQVLSQPQYSDNLQFQVNAYYAYRDILVRWATHPKNKYRERAAVGMLSVAQTLMEAERSGITLPERTFILPEKQGEKVQGEVQPGQPAPVQQQQTAPSQPSPPGEDTSGEAMEQGEDDLDAGEALEDQVPTGDEAGAQAEQESVPEQPGDAEAGLDDAVGETGEDAAGETAGMDEAVDEPDTTDEAEPTLDEPAAEPEVEPTETEEGESSTEEEATEADTTSEEPAGADTTAPETSDDEDAGLPDVQDETEEEGDDLWGGDSFGDQPVSAESEPAVEDTSGTEAAGDQPAEEEPAEEEPAAEEPSEEEPPAEEPAEEDTTNGSQGMHELDLMLASLPDLTPEGWNPFAFALASSEPLSWTMLAMQQQDPPETDTSQTEESDVFMEGDEETPAQPDTESAEGEPIAPPSAEEDTAMEEVAGQVAAEADTVAEEEKYEPVPLLESEKMFMEPLDSLVQSWPDNENVQDLVMMAQQIYYNKNHFPRARHYCRIMIDRFPNNTEYRDMSYRRIIMSYVRENDFENVERVAVEIEAAGIRGELLEDANMMAGKAIFMASDKAKAEGDLETAAANYRRVALDRPNYVSADDALWESGLTYMQAKSWDEAIKSFRLLAHTYPDSEFADGAYYNIASIFGDENQKPDKALAAATWDSLATLYPESDNAKVAVSEAARLYDELENWERALRMHEMYVEAFPEDTLAYYYLFEQAKFNLKLDREAIAMQIYEDFARQYPDDPRTVQAFLDRGEFYLNQRSDTTAAAEEFENTLVANQRIIGVQERKGEPANGFPEAASKAKDYLTTWKFREFRSIKFAGRPAQIEARREEKEALRLELIDDYNELLGYLQDEAFKAHFRIPQMAELFARAEQQIEREEMFDPNSSLNIDAATEIYNQEQAIAEEAISIMLGAAEQYTEGLDSLKVLMENMRQVRNEVQGTVDSLTEYLTQAQRDMLSMENEEAKTEIQDEVQEAQRRRSNLAENIDNLSRRLDIAQQWADSIRARIPMVHMKNAEIYSAVPNVLWTVEPVGDYDWAKMISEKAILEDLVVPAEILAMDYYEVAAQTADTARAVTSVALTNELQALADTARHRLIERADKLYDAYVENWDWALEEGYFKYRSRFTRLIDIDMRNRDFPGMGYTQDRWGMFVNLYPDEITPYQFQFIDFGASFATMSRLVLQEMQLDMDGWDTYYDPYADKLMAKIIDWVETVDSLRADDAAKKEEYTELSFENYDTLDTYLYAVDGFTRLEYNWQSKLDTIPGVAWEIPSQIYVQNEPYAEQIGRWLVRLKPAKWGHLAGLGETEEFLISDTTWWASADEYMNPEDQFFYFDTSYYHQPSYSSMPDPILDVEYVEGPKPHVIAYDSTFMVWDTVRVLEPDPNYVPPAPDTLGVDSVGVDTAAVDTASSGDGIIDEGVDLFAEDSLATDSAMVDSALADSALGDTLAGDSHAADSLATDTLAAEEEVEEEAPEGMMWVEKVDSVEVHIPRSLVFYLYKLENEDRITEAALNLTAYQNWLLWINGDLVDENTWDTTKVEDPETPRRWQYISNYPAITFLKTDPDSSNIIVVGVLNSDLAGADTTGGDPLETVSDDTLGTIGGLWFSMKYKTVTELTEDMKIEMPRKPANYDPRNPEASESDPQFETEGEEGENMEQPEEEMDTAPPPEAETTEPDTASQQEDEPF